MRAIRVVVIDDSAYNRRAIIKMLEAMPNVEVVGYATDGEEGIRKILETKPDLATLDLEMPKMDGFTLLRIVMNSFPLPIIVISSQSGDERVFKALELGAIDFIAKPTGRISDELLKIREDLHAKVSAVFNLNMARVTRREAPPVVETPSHRRRVDAPRPPKPLAQKADIVAIGSSTGGPPALQSIFSAFTEKLPFAVVVSQHMPAGFTKAFADRLNRSTAFEVREAKDGDMVVPGRILIAPGGRNMVFRAEDDGIVAGIVDPSPEDRYIPSVDAMFLSLAEICGPRVVGVILTGMGNDGSRGVKAIKGAGGQVLAEAEESSVVFGMPREAIATGLVDKVAHLDRMAREIVLRCGILDVLE
ncbi:MAG TPA: chemotaxis response regulator protein-glutamate methylesterase [Geobacteraceae bacterium]